MPRRALGRQDGSRALRDGGVLVEGEGGGQCSCASLGGEGRG